MAGTTGAIEPRLEQVRPGALPAHAAEPVRVVVLAAAQGLDDVHHLLGAVGIMLVEPGAEQGRDLEGEAHRQVETTQRSCLRGCLDDMLELVVGDLRHDRGDRDVAGDAGIVQRLDRGQTLARLRGARLERPRNPWIE